MQTKTKEEKNIQLDGKHLLNDNFKLTIFLIVFVEEVSGRRLGSDKLWLSAELAVIANFDAKIEYDIFLRDSS